MTELRKQMKIDLELKGYSAQTQSSYLRNVEKYALHYGKSPELLGTVEIRAYLHRLITIQKASSSHVNVVYSALKFLYETTLNCTWDLKKIPRTKKAKTLPVLLAPSELLALFAAITNLKHKVLLMTIYAAGLRISESTNLLITDIDSSNMQIRVRQGKGKKDRYTMLSIENLRLLRLYWKMCRPQVWLFPGKFPGKPMSTSVVQKIMKQALLKANIQKSVSVHTLRHCFATHLLEAGTNICLIQQLLGHSSLRSTSIYLHLTRKDLLLVQSPLDVLVGVYNA